MIRPGSGACTESRLERKAMQQDGETHGTRDSNAACGTSEVACARVPRYVAADHDIPKYLLLKSEHALK
jgi:hypothetical protein